MYLFKAWVRSSSSFLNEIRLAEIPWHTLCYPQPLILHVSLQSLGQIILKLPQWNKTCRNSLAYLVLSPTNLWFYMYLFKAWVRSSSSFLNEIRLAEIPWHTLCYPQPLILHVSLQSLGQIILKLPQWNKTCRNSLALVLSPTNLWFYMYLFKAWVRSSSSFLNEIRLAEIPWHTLCYPQPTSDFTCISSKPGSDHPQASSMK